MTRLLTISGLAFLCGLVAVAGAQEPQQFAFSFDTAESGYEGAGHAAADLDIVIDGNQLTAILRNTSPDAENFGSGLQSPAIIGWGFELAPAADGFSNGFESPDLALETWSLDGYKGTGEYRTLLRNSRYSQEDDVFGFRTRRMKNGLYNPAASGGIEKTDRNRANFTGDADGNTGATFTATFNGPIQLVEHTSVPFSPFVQFGYVGSAEERRVVNTFGTPTTSVAPAQSPEPGSLLIWAVGLAVCVGVSRRLNRKKAPSGTESPCLRGL